MNSFNDFYQFGKLTFELFKLNILHMWN